MSDEHINKFNNKKIKINDTITFNIKEIEKK